MNTQRKKLLLQKYKDRKPEMGVISFCCEETGESFLGISTDTRADLNSIRVKLSSDFHPNKRLLALWKEYGETGFKVTVLRTLKYEDASADHTGELEELRQECMSKDPKARKIWK